MCYEWEEELEWYDKDEEEKVPVDIGRLDIVVDLPEVQEPAEAA